jgi:hypothetical protein
MTVTFLKAAKTLTELKELYRKLAKEHHPDFGGSHEAMCKLNNEFEYLYGRLPKTKAEEASTETASEYMEVVKNLIAIPGITIELCGTWLWVTGETKPVKELLKVAGFKFAGKKVAWYWHSGEYRKRSRRKLSMEEIRALYGSKELEKEERERIA